MDDKKFDKIYHAQVQKDTGFQKLYDRYITDSYQSDGNDQNKKHWINLEKRVRLYLAKHAMKEMRRMLSLAYQQMPPLSSTNV